MVPRNLITVKSWTLLEDLKELFELSACCPVVWCGVAVPPGLGTRSCPVECLLKSCLLLPVTVSASQLHHNIGVDLVCDTLCSRLSPPVYANIKCPL